MPQFQACKNTFDLGYVGLNPFQEILVARLGTASVSDN
jgi:hypothetical protein